MPALWSCASCLQEKPVDEFYRRQTGPETGRCLQPCKACTLGRHATDGFKKKRRASRAKPAQYITKACCRCGLEFTYWWEPPMFRAGPGGWRETCDICLKHTKRMKAYGLTGPEVEALLLQEVCAICSEAFTASPHVDHDHATGKVRGLLCSTCNLALGYMRDRPDLLENAAAYLRGVAYA